MSKQGHLPLIPPANRSKKGTGDDTEAPRDSSLKHVGPKNLAVQGETANIKQNTTNRGFFQGRRIK